MPRRHLILGGSGAVGAVYANTLTKAGDEVVLYVREKYREALRRDGIVIHDLTAVWFQSILRGILAAGFLAVFLHLFTPLHGLLIGLLGPFFGAGTYLASRRLSRPPVQRLKCGEIACTPEEIRELQEPVDVVWICVNSAQLRGDWLVPVLEAAGPDALILSMTPGLDDHEYLKSVFPCEERYAEGLISIISYQAPLVGERFPATGTEFPGEGTHIAVFQPPMSPNLFHGPERLLQPIVAAMNRGGSPSEYSKQKTIAQAIGPGLPILLNFWPAVEVADWKFATLRSDADHLQVYLGAVREQIVYTCHTYAAPDVVRSVLLTLTQQRWFFKILLSILQYVFPFDFEVYLKFHFSKVRAQTELQQEHILRALREANLPHSSTQTLAGRFQSLS